MVLAINIGNTMIAAALGDRESFTTTRILVLASEAAEFTKRLEEFIETQATKVSGAIIASVNPNMTEMVERVVTKLFGVSPFHVSTSLDMRLDLSNYDTSLIGSDRIAVCEAAICKYALPAVVFDFGTATTINVIDKSGKYLGGSILPGLLTGAKALAVNTALLPLSGLTDQFEPVPLIGQNTMECIQSGIIHGNAAMFDGMIERISQQIGEVSVIVTGGYAKYLLPMCRSAHVYDENLLITGLYELYKGNVG